MSIAPNLIVPVRRVKKVVGGYMVEELVTWSGWKSASKVYGHSTSAFAALGRLTQKEYEKSFINKKKD